MTATLANPRLSAAWLPVQETAAELRDECSTLDALVQDLFADIDRLQTELETKADEVEDGRRRLAERGRQLAEQRKETSRLTHQLDEQETRLNETLTEVRALREQISQEQEASRQRQKEEFENLQQRFSALEAERDALRRQLQAADPAFVQSPSVSIDPVLDELAALRQQIVETSDQIGAAIGHVAEQQASTEAVPGEESAEELATLQQEKAELELELELVRTRAAELYETVAAQKRELTEHRAELSSELKQLLRLAEQQAQHPADREPVESHDDSVSIAQTTPWTKPETKSEAASAGADPVVSSVMAQFAKLQKDVSQRRKKK